MRPDEAYRDHPVLGPARHLQRAGRWDEALGLLSGADYTQALDLRADILCDRHQWRLDDRSEAVAAIDAIGGTNAPLATLLTAQLEYWVRLFRRNVMAGAGVDADLGDLPTLVKDPVEEFRIAAGSAGSGDDGLRDWAMFWYAVSSENVRDDLETARPVYAEVSARATERGELLLASYASRHLGGVALFDDGKVDQGLELLRLSMYQRATVGARPHLAAAQAMYAMALDDAAAAEPGTTPKPDTGPPGTAGPETTLLRSLVRHTAQDLDLTWLK
jgi:hypothetical protein